MYQLKALRSSAMYTGYWICVAFFNLITLVVNLLPITKSSGGEILLSLVLLMVSAAFLFFSVRTMKRSFARLTYTIKSNNIVDNAFREFIKSETVVIEFTK